MEENLAQACMQNTKGRKGIATEKKSGLQEYGPEDPEDRESDPGIADRAASEEAGCVTDAIAIAREWTPFGKDGVTAWASGSEGDCWGRCHFGLFVCLLDCEV